MELNRIYQGNCLDILPTLPDNSVHCVITSPPYYGLRDYGVDNQIGLEDTPEEYVERLLEVFREVKRILKPDGTFWLNIGDTYWGSNCRANDYREDHSISNPDLYRTPKPQAKKHHILKPKDLIGIPWRVAFALQEDGWYLRQDIIWAKPNAMPESVKDRCVKSHEYVFLLTKSRKYYFDYKAIQEPAAYDGRQDTFFKGCRKNYDGVIPGAKPHSFAKDGHERWQRDEQGNFLRNKRSVWLIPTRPFKDAHFAVFPEDLVEPMMKAGCPPGGIVLDPFFGSGTVGVVAIKLGRSFVGIELNPEYVEMAGKRLSEIDPLFGNKEV